MSVDFDGGAISPIGGLLLLREVVRSLGLTRMLASRVEERRGPSRFRLPTCCSTRPTGQSYRRDSTHELLLKGADASYFGLV